MKLRQESEIDVADIGTVDEIKSTIADENLGLALTMMSKNLYSDPIGSFIREITSNAVDANVDANIDEPVVVHLFEEDDAYFIEFRDNGTGMSPETFTQIYMSWFNSDKRDTNDKIGGWGLGSKSPLAYQNYFEIITRHNGTKYHYVMSNESTEPKADKLSEEETDERNGTTIRIEVNREDVYQVSRDCERQLAYFKTVYVKNEVQYYDNNFNIYEKGLWKLRNNDQPFPDMHICLGQVSYPINWNVLEIEPIKIPVALSFNVGELDVTVSREEINYTDRVREALKERIQLVTDELSELYSQQLQVDDFFDYFKIVSNREKPPLKIEDVEISMTGIRAKLQFRNFKNLRVKKGETDDIFAAYLINRIRNGKIDDSYRTHYLKIHEVENAYLIRGKMNFHDTRYIGDGLLFRKRKITKTVYRAYAGLLGQIVWEDINGYYTKKVVYKQGAAKVINEFLKVLHAAMDARLKIYDGICPDYDKEAYNAEQREIKERRKEHITFYSANNNRHQTNIQNLIEGYKYVFYVQRDKSFRHKNTVQAMYDTLNENFQNQTTLIFLAKTAINRLKKYDSMMPFEDIFHLPEMSNHFYSYNIANMIEQNLQPYKGVFRYSSYYMNLYNKLYAKFGIDLTATVRVEKEHHNSYGYASKEEVNLFEYFNEYITRATTNKNYDEYRTIYRTLLNVASELRVLNYLCDDTPSEVVASLIRGKGITKMDEQFYKTHV
jgi:hypothetical protein